ncbi:translation initiation factor IF-2-like [Antechinus flavipes]|uniref:translation initiation factor IF-2-like n=1 Tax=Antechinus flavipes TaxID=38775 RepID=UPI002235AFC7|nr:translation initiation factor IF-2-like [Antechinus flavipes]
MAWARTGGDPGERPKVMVTFRRQRWPPPPPTLRTEAGGGDPGRNTPYYVSSHLRGNPRLRKVGEGWWPRKEVLSNGDRRQPGTNPVTPSPNSCLCMGCRGSCRLSPGSHPFLPGSRAGGGGGLLTRQRGPCHLRPATSPEPSHLLRSPPPPPEDVPEAGRGRGLATFPRALTPSCPRWDSGLCTGGGGRAVAQGKRSLPPSPSNKAGSLPASSRAPLPGDLWLCPGVWRRGLESGWPMRAGPSGGPIAAPPSLWPARARGGASRQPRVRAGSVSGSRGQTLPQPCSPESLAQLLLL